MNYVERIAEAVHRKTAQWRTDLISGQNQNPFAYDGRLYQVLGWVNEDVQRFRAACEECGCDAIWDARTGIFECKECMEESGVMAEFADLIWV